MMEIRQTLAMAPWTQQRGDPSPKPATENGESTAQVPVIRKDQKDKPWLTDPGFENVLGMDDYIRAKKAIASIERSLIKIEYDRFKKEFETAHPDLLISNAGFKLGPDNQLALIDVNDEMSTEAKTLFTEALNNFHDLRKWVLDYALRAVSLSRLEAENLQGHRAQTLSEIRNNIIYAETGMQQTREYAVSFSSSRIDTVT